jgi:hypothetical protein
MAALQKSPRRGGAAQREGRPGPRYVSPWPKAENIWCDTGTQDWTIRDAARERLVLTKTDEEPGCSDAGCIGNVHANNP